MNESKEFSMIDAFVALNAIDDDSVSTMLKSDTKLHEGKSFPLYGGNQGLDAAREFLNENDETQIEVIDVDADSLEHVKDRIDYVGQVILRCNRCHANKFIDMDKLIEVEGDEGVYNMDDECPNCKTSDTGYELIGQVGKYQEEEPEAETTEDETAPAEEEVAVENDEVDADEVKFDNDEAEPEVEPTEAEVVDVTDDSDADIEPDMMETSTSEDDDLLDLPALGDEVDADDELEADEDEEDVKESLNEEFELTGRAAEAWMMNRVMQVMNDERAYYGQWLSIWPDGETMEMCAEDFSSKSDFDELKELFLDSYIRYHEDGLFEADDEELAYAHEIDRQLGLRPIDNHKTYTEAIEILHNTSVNEVLGSVLDADRIGKVVVSNCDEDGKAQEIYSGEYANLPINIASADCKSFDVADHQLACNIDRDENHGRRSVKDILDKFSDDETENVSLYDIASSEEVFRGKKADAINQFGTCGFISIDTPAIVRLVVCDPSIVSAPEAEETASKEDKLVEHIFSANGLSMYRLNKPTTNEYWVKQSIMEGEDLDLIYESYIKPCGKDLVAEFKAVTGYKNALDEAFEAGYEAAKESSTEADEVDDVIEAGRIFIRWVKDDEITYDDIVDISRDGDTWIAAGEVVSVEGTNLVEAILSVIEAANAPEFDDEVEYDAVEIALDSDLEDNLSESEMEEIAEKSGYEFQTEEDDSDEDEAEDLDEAFMSRDQMIAELKKAGRNYHFEKYSDAQIYRMYQKHVLNAPKAAVEAPQPTLFDQIKAPTCSGCGNRLAEDGSCPVCDHGEEDIGGEIDAAQKIDTDEKSTIDVDISDAVAKAIHALVVEHDVSISDENLDTLIFDYICDHIDAGMPEDKEAYEVWSNAIYDEVAKQLNEIAAPEFSEVSEDLDDDDDWADIDNELEIEAEDTYMSEDLLRELVANEFEFALKECGKSLNGLSAYFMGILEEAELGKVDPVKLKSILVDQLQNHDVIDFDESCVKSFKTRKELGDAITECKNNSRPYTVRRSKTEGYRYDLILEADTPTEKPAEEAAQDSIVDTSKKETVELNEGENLPAPQDQETHLATSDQQLADKIRRVASDIADALKSIYNVDVPVDMIITDILQDLQLIGHDIEPRDLPDTPVNRLTAEMFRSTEQFWEWLDHLVSLLSDRPISTTPEQRLQAAIKALDSSNFSKENIERGLRAREFQRMLAAGQVPFIPANAAPQLEEEVEVPVETFDAELNEYFNETYDDTVVYTTTEGMLRADGSIILEGTLKTESIESPVTFTFKPDTTLTESLVEAADKRSVIENLTYTVTNNLSEEVFTFKFSE